MQHQASSPYEICGLTVGQDKHPFPRGRSGLTKDERLVLYGDESELDPVEVERHRATWKRFPDDPVFLASYVLRSIAKGQTTPDSIDGFERSEAIDPDNALYPYLRASAASRQAFEIDHDENGLHIEVLDSVAAELFYQKMLDASAAALVEALINFYDQLVGDAIDALIDWVVLMAATELIGHEVPKLAEGLPIRKDTEDKIGKLSSVASTIQAQLHSEREFPFLEETKMHGGLLAVEANDIGSELAWDPDMRFDLAPGRWLDYVILERISLVGFLGILLSATGWCFLRYAWIRWRRRLISKSHSAIPILLVPTAKEIALVIGVGVILPLVAYVIYSRWTAISGRDLNATSLIWRFVAEQVSLWLVMIAAAAFLTRRAVHSRFRRLGIEAEDDRSFFRATLMRSVTPVLAAVALVTALVAHPFLETQKARLVQADTMMSIDPNGGFSQFESKMAEAIRETMLAISE